jgi:hypothetical protein
MIMQYVDWFVATIKDKFDMVVDSEEVSFEPYEFYVIIQNTDVCR